MNNAIEGIVNVKAFSVLSFRLRSKNIYLIVILEKVLLYKTDKNDRLHVLVYRFFSRKLFLFHGVVRMHINTIKILRDEEHRKKTT